MEINWLRAVFFIAGGAVVAASAAYVTGALDIFFPERPAAVASLPQTTSSAPAATARESAAPKVGESAVPAGQADTPQQAEPEVIVPAFDLVRVEPDGSLVIAGRAAPIANVEIVTGASTIGMGEANVDGEFAIVLDEPLKPGDYTIVLRSTSRDAIVATSTESAIVSIPDNENGQVLALVEQPGAPSRLITVPEAAAPKQDRPVAAAPNPVAPNPVAPEPKQPTQSERAAASPQQQPAETASAQQAAGKPAEQTASGAAEEPPAQVEQELAGAPAESAPAADKPQQDEQIATVPQPQPAQEQSTVPAEPRIAVEAVEIEGTSVFVAGRAETGSRVRVYANDILLGDSATSDGGRFLVEAERDLPVGDYIVRADLLGANADVLARAAVPFEREPGEAVAAVATPDPQAAVQQPAAQGAASAEPEAAKPAETAAADDGGQEPAAEQPAAEAAAPAQQTGENPDERQVASAPAASKPATAESEPGHAVQPKVVAGPEVTAPKLQKVAGSVIIRRGDSLWRISKRVYGRGVRYTTIYLANQDQIADPDRIWPGQVFNVPGKTGKGEDADMSAVADRLLEAQTQTR